MAVTYDKRVGQFRGLDGRYVARAEILRLLDAESARLQIRLQGHARLMAQNRITISTFQERMADELKLSHLRSAMLASGGEKQLTPRHFGAIGQELKRQYQYLYGFGHDLANGKLSAKHAIARAKSYGLSTKTAFYQAEKITRKGHGATEAKRSLDSQSRHCISCLNHSTRGRWLPIDNVVAPGVSCECQSRCNCRVVYRGSLSASLDKVA